MMCVHQQQEVAVADELTALAATLDRTTGNINPQTARKILLPLGSVISSPCGLTQMISFSPSPVTVSDFT